MVLTRIGLEFFHGNDPKIRQIQRDHVKKVIDTVNDLDNIFFEVVNECSATQWQHELIDFIHDYETKHKPKRHLVLMSPGGPDVKGKWTPQDKKDVTSSHAEVIAVLNAWGDYTKNPPVNDTRRPAIMDMDHISPDGSDDSVLPWKALTRGYHYCIFEPTFPNVAAGKPSWELARRNVGAIVTYTRRFSDLAAARPQGDVASTQFCLAHLGQDYLVFQPQSEKAFTVRLEDGKYRAEWFQPESAKVEKAGVVESKGGE